MINRIEKCMICGSEEIKDLILAGTKYSCCNSCFFIFRNPLPNLEDVQETYSESEKHEYEFYYNFMTQNGIDNILLGENARLNHIEQKFGNFHSIIDIGSGLGTFVSICKRNNKIAVGIEPNKLLAKISRELFDIPLINIPVNRNTIDIIKYKVNILFSYPRVDVVTMFHSLEHILDLDSLFRLVNSLTKFGGFLVIEVPNIYSKTSLIQKEKWEGITPSHLYFFSEESLKKLLDFYGFDLIECDYSIREEFKGEVLDYVANFLTNFNSPLLKKLEKMFTDTSFTCFAKKVGLPKKTWKMQ